MKPSRWNVIFVLCSLLFLLIVEWLQSFRCLQDWPHIPVPDETEVRLLLVADPHLQVYHSSWYYPVEMAAITDNDWYLKRYFGHILNRFRPTVILFLGDLVEEGSEIPSDALDHAFNRFEHIFMLPSIFVATFLVPGDNDVGGEWNDPLTKYKMDRFRAHFVSYPRTRQIRFVKLFVDPLNTKWVSPRFLSLNNSELISVYVSHVPMITTYGADLSPSLLRSEPSLLINGHDHVAYVLEWIKTDSSLERIGWLIPPDGRELGHKVFQTVLNSSLRTVDNEPQGRLIQFGVPSCSYRSGQTHLLAYGLARIYQNRTVTYQLILLPDRWNFFLLCGTVFTACVFLRFVCTKRPRSAFCACLCLGFSILIFLLIESFCIFFFN